MNKITEPLVEPTMTKEEEAYYNARALQGLAEAERGEGIPVEEFRAKMEARIAASKASKS